MTEAEALAAVLASHEEASAASALAIETNRARGWAAYWTAQKAMCRATGTWMRVRAL